MLEMLTIREESRLLLASPSLVNVGTAPKPKTGTACRNLR